MKQRSIVNFSSCLQTSLVLLVMIGVSHLILSFTVRTAAEGFIRQLGISKADTDSKIMQSIMGGYLDEQGVPNAKKIAIVNRSAITNEILVYAKQQLSTPSFIKEYAALRESKKPKQNKVETPEEMKKGMILEAQKAVEQNEALLKKADLSLKPVFKEVLEAAKKNLKDVQDSNNKQIVAYTKNYGQLLKSIQESYASELVKWETEFPKDPNHFIRHRLQQFLNETENIDFAAELMDKGGKKVFVNTRYEKNGKRWKMAYRAGKEVVVPAREFVQKWIAEIN